VGWSASPRPISVSWPGSAQRPSQCSSSARPESSSRFPSLLSLTSGSRLSDASPSYRNRAGHELHHRTATESAYPGSSFPNWSRRVVLKREPLLFSSSFSYLRVPICPSWRSRVAEAWVSAELWNHQICRRLVIVSLAMSLVTFSWSWRIFFPTLFLCKLVHSGLPSGAGTAARHCLLCFATESTPPLILA
jgi:hypothetical protein